MIRGLVNLSMHKLGLDLDLDMLRKISISVSDESQLCCGGPCKSGDQLVQCCLLLGLIL